MTILATFSNQSVPSGTFNTPAQVVAADLRRITLRMSRENWPAAGVQIAILLSFDGGATYPTIYNYNIAQWVDDGNPKHQLCDAVITLGWSAPQPTHVKARSISPGVFASTITIEGYS